MSLAEKTALVTGGGSGIGQAIAWRLAGAGCRVAIAGRDQAKLQATAANGAGPQPILFRAADVSKQAEADQLVAWAERELGRIDILVNNAGVNVLKRSLAELDPADWQRMIDTNASGVFYLMRAALPAMRSRRDGLIVNIGSVSSKRAGLLGGVGYNASKFALAALGITAGLEEGKNGIRVTTICPGEVNTPILDRRPKPVSAEHRASILQPEDVADAVLMVAQLPPRAHIVELIIMPTWQDFC